MSDILSNRDLELLSSDQTAFKYVSEADKKKFANYVIKNLGKDISNMQIKKYKKPLKYKLKEFFIRLFNSDKKEKEKIVEKYAMSLINYKNEKDD